MAPSQCTWKSMLVTDADLTLGYRVITCCIYMHMTFTNCLVYHLRNITPAYARTTNLPTCCIQSPKRTANLLYPIVNTHCQSCCFNLLRLRNYLLPLRSLWVMEHLDTWALGELLLKEGISCRPLKVIIGSDTQLCITTKVVWERRVFPQNRAWIVETFVRNNLVMICQLYYSYNHKVVKVLLRHLLLARSITFCFLNLICQHFSPLWNQLKCESMVW